MKGRKKSLLLLTIPFLVFIILLKVGFEDSDKESEYYRNVGLKLSGTIINVQPLSYGHDYGVISVNITQSNIEEYDKRNELNRYLGVIKNGKADLVFNSMSSVKIGDSINLNVRNYQLYRNDKLIDENVIGMPPSNFIFTPFNEINRKIKL